MLESTSSHDDHASTCISRCFACLIVSAVFWETPEGSLDTLRPRGHQQGSGAHLALDLHFHLGALALFVVLVDEAPRICTKETDGQPLKTTTDTASPAAALGVAMQVWKESYVRFLA